MDALRGVLRACEGATRLIGRPFRAPLRKSAGSWRVSGELLATSVLHPPTVTTRAKQAKPDNVGATSHASLFEVSSSDPSLDDRTASRTDDERGLAPGRAAPLPTADHEDRPDRASRPTSRDLLARPGALLTRSHLRALGLERRAVDAIFRALPIVAIPGYSRPMIRVEDYLALIEQNTYGDDRVRSCRA
jgi:hypothetical protein